MKIFWQFSENGKMVARGRDIDFFAKIPAEMKIMAKNGLR